jgi:hypothetical protein
VRLDDLAADGETETEPRAIRAALLEGAKERLGFSGRETAALVFDIDEDVIMGGTRSEPDVALGMTKLDRVLEQIGYRRCKQLPVRIDRNAVGRSRLRASECRMTASPYRGIA